MSNEIRDESTEDQKRFQLYVNNEPRGLVTLGSDHRVRVYWQAVGPFSLGETKAWIEGLFNLTVIADKLSVETDRAKA